MAGTPDSTVILHWDQCEAEWAELPWRDWVRFRGFDESGFRLLVGRDGHQANPSDRSGSDIQRWRRIKENY